MANAKFIIVSVDTGLVAEEQQQVWTEGPDGLEWQGWEDKPIALAAADAQALADRWNRLTGGDWMIMRQTVLVAADEELEGEAQDWDEAFNY